MSDQLILALLIGMTFLIVVLALAIDDPSERDASIHAAPEAPLARSEPVMYSDMGVASGEVIDVPGHLPDVDFGDAIDTHQGESPDDARRTTGVSEAPRL